MIGKLLPGINTYKKVTKDEAKEFVNDLDPVQPRRSLFMLPFILFCFISNMIIINDRMKGD
jgi:hypothetical protein